MKKNIVLSALVAIGVIFGLSVPDADHHQEGKASLIATDSGLTNVGFAPFTLTSPKFDCDKFFDDVKDITILHVAFLYNTFGNDFTCFERLKKDPRLHTLEVELVNEPGHRNNRLGDYEFLARFPTPRDYERALIREDKSLRSAFFKYVRRLQNRLSDLPAHVTLFINPGLESNISPEAFAILAKWTREAFPNARVVFNPIKPGGFKDSTGDVYEQHGGIPQVKAPCIINTDGTDINFSYIGGRKSIAAILAENDEDFPKNYINAGAPLQQYIEQYANTCEVVFLWIDEDNFLQDGLVDGKVVFTDPRKRPAPKNNARKELANQIKIAHTRGRILPASLEYTQEELAPLSGCERVIELKDAQMGGAVTDGIKSGFILKQSEFPDRGSALILPSGRRAQLLYRNKVIENFQYAGPYKHDSKRSLFRGKNKPSSYRYNTVLRVDGGRICYKIPNPRIRND